MESALAAHEAVAEAAVIGLPHEIKGEAIHAYITLKLGRVPSDALRAELVEQVRRVIGPIATPEEMQSK